MKKILLSVVLVFAGTLLWAQAITGDSVLDAKIKTESQKLGKTGGSDVIIDEATETILQYEEETFKVSTKIWPKNKLTENLAQPKFCKKIEASVEMIYKFELTSFYALTDKCERADVEKYVEELKAAGWNIDAETKNHENVYAFDAQHKSGLYLRITHNLKDKQLKIKIMTPLEKNGILYFIYDSIGGEWRVGN